MLISSNRVYLGINMAYANCILLFSFQYIFFGGGGIKLFQCTLLVNSLPK